MKTPGSGAMLKRVALRCLIVDDNSDFLQAVRALLERDGLEVVGVAHTLAEAVSSAAALEPDVALVDMYLGEENGLDLARKLTRSDAAASTTVIVVSTYTEGDVLELLADIPAIQFLWKGDLSSQAIMSAVGQRAKS
jgi:DNA-binding NarL/FixJ family response regulator